jgi:hypothetical protein
MATASVQPPEQTCCSIRITTVTLERLGYQVDRIIYGLGESMLRIG